MRTKYQKALDIMIDRGDFEEGMIYDVSYSEARIQGLRGGVKEFHGQEHSPNHNDHGRELRDVRGGR